MVSYTFTALIIFIIFTTVMHLVGYRARDRYPKKIWKSADYIWLPMAIIGIIGAAGEATILNAKNIIEVGEAQKKNLHTQLRDAEKQIMDIQPATESQLSYYAIISGNKDFGQSEYEELMKMNSLIQINSVPAI